MQLYNEERQETTKDGNNVPKSSHSLTSFQKPSKKVRNKLQTCKAHLVFPIAADVAAAIGETETRDYAVLLFEHASTQSGKMNLSKS